MSGKMKSSIEARFFDLVGAHSYLGGGLSIKALRRLIAEPGGLPSYKVRGKILLKRSDLDTWLAARRREPQDLDVLAAEAVQEILAGR